MSSKNIKSATTNTKAAMVESCMVTTKNLESAINGKSVLGAMVFDHGEGESQGLGLNVPQIYMHMFIDQHNKTWLGAQDKLKSARGRGRPKANAEVEAGEKMVELWLCDEKVEYQAYDGWQVALSDNYLFATMSFDDDGYNIAELTQNAYMALFALLERQQFNQLLRIWNFMPRINEDDANGLERYRTFCMGRADAFSEYFKEVEVRMPAATGIGTQSGKIAIAVMAQRGLSDVLHIENPKQTPAYYYPKKYGPRSPSFARATSLFGEKEQLHHVFISGTAAVVGSETVHHGDIKKQTETTFDNLRALVSLDNMRAYGINAGYDLKDIHSIKVYVRYLKDLPIIKPLCEAAFADADDIVYLHADVCRDDLDIEIEGVISAPLTESQQLEELKQHGTLVDYFVHKVHQNPLKTAYVLLDENGEQAESISFTRLHHEVLQTAACLQRRCEKGQGVILALENSTSFIIHYFACIFAGLIAVPVPFNRNDDMTQTAKRISAIVQSLQLDTVIYTHSRCVAELKLALTQQAFANSELDEHARNRIQSTICLSDNQVIDRAQAFYQFQEVDQQSITTILYTSGSVAQPKGIPLNHQNLIACARANAEAWQYQDDSVSVSWMPHSHSFGLVFNILLPLFTGTTCVMSSPEHFVAKPTIWLDAITNYKASHSAGAAFGYDHLLTHIANGKPQQWDLSSWQVALISAENIREVTCRQFVRQLSPYGALANALSPVYGLSETGPITVKPLSEEPRFSANSYQGSATTVTSVGVPVPGVEICCIEVEGNRVVEDGQLGEIAVAGASVIEGYWQLPAQNEAVFSQTIVGQSSLFFRTGDLGFIQDGQLYVVGRIKEVIIVNGKNHYPIDIESTINAELSEFATSKIAALGIIDEQTGLEQLHLVLEAPTLALLSDPAQLSAVSQKIVQLVLNQAHLRPACLYWLKTGSIPRTKSGKIQRTKCKVQLQKGELVPDYQYDGRQLIAIGATRSAAVSEPTLEQQVLRREHVVEQLDRLVEAQTPQGQFDPQWQFLTELNISSVQFIALSRALSEAFQLDLAAGKLYQLSNKADLLEYIVNLGKLPVEHVSAELPLGVVEEDIAVIGMSCFLPGADSPAQFWQNLLDNKDTLVDIEQLQQRDLPKRLDHLLQDKQFPSRGGFIEHAETFDAAFFNITPKEAALLDPQQRKTLELGWSLFEDAGLKPAQLKGSNTAVYWGYHTEDYKELVMDARMPSDPLMNTALHGAMLANRLSYWFDLRGTSETVNTACSSSLVAVDKAIKALHRGECEMAIAGGINLMLSPRTFEYTLQAKMLNPAGYCATLSDEAAGIVRAEGAGALLLKPLSKALEDGDHIHGLLKGSAASHGGKTSGLTVPSAQGQKDVIQSAWRHSGHSIKHAGYFELHGTGTRLGDPIEVQALADLLAHKEGVYAQVHCAIGSAKSNIGHTESASGVAGLIKAILQLKHRQLVATLHCQPLNTDLPLNENGLAVCVENQPWADNRERLCGVSSFGLGGSLAHVVVAEYPGQPKPRHQQRDCGELIFVLSAKTPQALAGNAKALATYLLGQGLHQELEDIAYTLQVGREALPHRLLVMAKDRQQLSDKLNRVSEHLNANQGIKVDACQYAKVGAADALLSQLFEGKNGQQFVQGLLAENGQHKLGALWLQGIDIPWHELYLQSQTTAPPRRIALPTYCFERKRFWAIESQPQQTAPAQADAQAVIAPGKSLLSLEMQWRPQAIALSDAALEQTVLVVGPDDKWLDALKLRFAKVMVVSSSAELAALGGLWREIAAVIDMRALNDNWLEDQAQCLDDLQLVQSIMANAQQPLSWLLLSLPAKGKARDALAIAAVAEQSQHRLKLIELQHKSPEQLGQIVLDELADDSQERLQRIGYQQDQRLVGQYQALPLAALPVASFTAPQVALVTGGTRGIGLVLAEHLVKRYGYRHLILLSASGLPEPALWPQLLVEQNAQAESIKRLDALRQMGVNVVVVADDLQQSQRLNDKMAKAFFQLQQLDPSITAIDGVVHCAGRFDDRHMALQQKTTASAAAILAPKVSGTCHLHQAVERINRQQSCRFFILASSIAAQVPSLSAGLADYAAANAWMDQYAEQTFDQGMTALLSIAWPNWADTGFKTLPSPTYQRLGFDSLSQSEGLMLFDLAMQQVGHKPRFMPCITQATRLDVDAIGGLGTMMVKTPAVSGITAPAERDEKPSQAIHPKTVAIAHTHDWQAYLLSLFEQQFGLEDIDASLSFGELGIDSVLLTSIVNTLNKNFAIELSPSVVFDYETIDALAAHLDSLNPLEASQPESQLSLPHQPIEALAQSAEINVSDVPAELQSLVAVTGSACCFAKAQNKQSFWQLLLDGDDAFEVFPKERQVISPQAHLYGATLFDAGHFDAEYFHLSDEDAGICDPQARLLLEQTLAAITDAGLSPKQLQGSKTGVYIGGRAGQLWSWPQLLEVANPILGAGQNYLASNISRHFGLNGPSLVVDTACSSALVAMQLAMTHLRSGEIDQAIVGGVNILADDTAHALFKARNILSPDNRFYLFDKRAQGEILGEGGAVIILQRLDNAIKEGAQVQAVIRHIAVNNDGRTAGFASPNPQQQQAVMTAALAQSGVKAEQVDYIETNGSGSTLGDLLELNGIGRVYGPNTQACLGNVKGQIGHLLAAAGMAGFIRNLLCLEQRLVPQTQVAELPLEHLETAAKQLNFNRQALQFAPRQPMVMAQNSFADGGTNCHVLLSNLAAVNEVLAGYRPTRGPLTPVALKRRVFPLRGTPSAVPNEVVTATMATEASADFWNFTVES